MIGSRLKIARTSAHHTQASLAEIMNTDARQIWRWENNENDPSGEVVAKLAVVLEVTSDYLLGLTSEPTNEPIRQNDLSDRERSLVWAFRHGDIREALKALVGDE